MERFLGETADFWMRVRAAMRKARIESAEELEARLGVSPPIYEVRADWAGSRWEIVERRPIFGQERVVGWGATKGDAERLCASMSRAMADG